MRCPREAPALTHSVIAQVKLFHAGLRALGARVSHFLFHVGPAPRRPAAGTSDDPVMVFDDDEGKRVDHPIEVG